MARSTRSVGRRPSKERKTSLPLRPGATGASGRPIGPQDRFRQMAPLAHGRHLYEHGVTAGEKPKPRKRDLETHNTMCFSRTGGELHVLVMCSWECNWQQQTPKKHRRPSGPTH